MFEEYIEKELQRHLKIIRILWEGNFTTSMELASEIEVSSITIMSDIKCINKLYCEIGKPLIVSSTTGYSILGKVKKNIIDYERKVYRSSLFLRGVVFFLTTNFSKAEKFSEMEYISQAKAYQVKKEVGKYLEEVGVITNGRFNDREECKIRFLLAFFQWELGISSVKLTQDKIKRYDLFIREVEIEEECIYSIPSKEYAMILFQIGFMRRKFSDRLFDSPSQTVIEELSLHERLKKICTDFLKKEFSFSISSSEVLYLTLIFNVMNSNYINIKKKQGIFFSESILYKKEYPKYNNLVNKLEIAFNMQFRDNEVFQGALFIFLSKCILNLQKFIPEEHVALGRSVKIPEEIQERVEEVFKQWSEDMQINLQFSKAHIYQFSSKLVFLLRKKTKIKTIYLLTSFYSDYLLAKDVLEMEFEETIAIEQFNIFNLSQYKENDIILCDGYYPYLDKILSKKIQIEYLFDDKELQKIRSLVISYNVKAIEKCISSNIKST